MLMTVNTAQSQRVYAPEITGNGDVQVTNESLVYILRPEKIKNIETTEKQIHIELEEGPREYFYTLTSLNRGKKLTIKTLDGETVQSGIIKRAVDSGVIISKNVKDRGALSRLYKRIKNGERTKISIAETFKKAKEANTRFIENTSKIVTTPEIEGPKIYFESPEELKKMREELNAL